MLLKTSLSFFLLPSSPHPLLVFIINAPTNYPPFNTYTHTHIYIYTLTTKPNQKTVAITRFKNETIRIFGVLEIQLSGKYTGSPREYLAGSGKGKYSVADIGTWPWIKVWSFIGLTEEDMKPFPHLLKWIDRIAARPAVQRGIGESYKQ